MVWALEKFNMEIWQPSIILFCLIINLEQWLFKIIYQTELLIKLW